MEVVKLSEQNTSTRISCGVHSTDRTKDSFSAGKLPAHVQFARSGINTINELEKFVFSENRWAGIDVRLDTVNDSLIVRKEPFEKKPPSANEEFIPFEECLGKLYSNNKAAQINIEGGHVVEKIINTLSGEDVRDHYLWFNAGIDCLTGHQFINLSVNFPGSVIQCNTDFIVPLIREAPDNALKILDSLSAWGVNRFSFNWDLIREKQVVDFMNDNGYEVNFYNIADLDNLVRAILMLPRSVTYDFDMSESDQFSVYSQCLQRSLDFGFAVGR